MSQFSGHGDLVQNRKQEAVVEQRQQPRPRAHAAGPAGAGDLVAALTAAGVAGSIAAELVSEHSAGRIRDALEAVSGKRLHNPAGWLVRAVAGSWDLSPDVEQARIARVRAQARARQAALAVERPEREEQRLAHEAAWEAAISSALDEGQLAEAIERLTVPLPALGRRSVPTTCAALRRWAQAVAAADPGRPLTQALREALAARPTPADVPDTAPAVGAPAAPTGPAADLGGRVADHLDRARAVTRPPPASGHELSL